jgi:hypothetical protein
MTGKVLADDEWGDYLIYRLYPDFRAFVDGRSDFYGDDFERTYLDLFALKGEWEETLSKYRIDTILLRKAAPLAAALKVTGRWRPVYQDDVAVVFSRARQEEQQVSASLNTPRKAL